MKRNTENMVALNGYIRCGHIAIKAHGFTAIIAGPVKSSRLLERRIQLCPIDRVVSAQEFCNVTGLSVVRGASDPVKPKSKRAKKRTAMMVSNFIGE